MKKPSAVTAVTSRSGSVTRWPSSRCTPSTGLFTS